MQPLPANGQAQPLPGKWVIKRTPANAEMVNKWANDNDDVAFNYHEDNGYIHSEAVYKVGLPISFFHPKPLPSFTLITDSQFKAMVEGDASQSINDLKWFLEGACDKLMAAKEWDLAAALKAKHPDIWPVDYAAIVLEKAVAWYESNKDQYERLGGFNEVSSAVMEAVRNYLTNQK